MTIESLEEAIAALQADPSGLLGIQEDSWLEFKSRPYQLESAKQRVELAKDVSAFANSEGGLLVLGIETTKNDSSSLETASKLRPIPRDLVDPERLQKIVHEGVYPHLDLKIHCIPVAGSEGVLWALQVDSHLERDRPFVTTREILGEEDRTIRHAFTVYRRVGAMSVPFPQSQVHHWMRGSWTDSAQTSQMVQAAEESQDTDQALMAEIEDSGIEENEGVYALQIRIDPPTELASFYEGSSNSISDALSRLPYFRYAGFNFLGRRDPQRVRGDSVRLPDNGKTILSISATGLLTAIQRSYQLHWAWEKSSQRPEEGIHINKVALVEFTLEACRHFSDLILPRCGKSPRVFWRVMMMGLRHPFPMALTGGWMDTYKGPPRQHQEGDDFRSNWRLADDLKPGRLALQVLTAVFNQFGWDQEVVPFQKDGEIQADLLPN